ncbi:MAG TPA: protein translocase subunit SecD [Acidimicrobiia bacterium]
MRRNVVYLVATVVVALGALVATIVAGLSPVLGLDLQGGVSVRLVPVGDPSSGSLDVAVDIIRNRVDALGVAEAEVTREGDNIVVNLPGVKDRDKAQRIVGRTAELRFRPVLAQLPPEDDPAATTTTTAGPATSTPPESTTTTTAPPDDAAITAAVASCDPAAVSALPSVPNTTRADDTREACVVLPGLDDDGLRYYLGSTAMTGQDTGSADAEFQGGQYSVVLELEDEGREKFNELAAESFPKQPPQNAVAIVLDGVVQSAPAFQEPEFPGDVSITGDFTRTEAEDLARLLRYGALPVRFDESQQTVENVSPTLGNDQLRAGITAGIIGIVLVFLYMFIYYRILALVVVLGLALTAAGTYALVSYLGESIGLALTLAGVTGLIVSVGVTVDSYIVYFERLKDEVRSGKTVRSSVDRGFVRSFRTILAADLVSLIGAAVLYLLAIGSVRGFAFFLGLATLLDLAVTYFFMHPLVVLLARRPGLLRARYVGIASGLDAAEVTA